MKFAPHPTLPLTQVCGRYTIVSQASAVGALWRLRFDGEPLGAFSTLRGAIAAAEEHADREPCAYCGARVESPCDEPPPDTCEKALAATYGRRTGSLR